MEEADENEKSALSLIWRYLFSHVGLCLLVASYVVGGAMLFRHLEYDIEERALRTGALVSQRIEEDRERLADNIFRYKWSFIYEKTVDELLQEYHDNITDAIVSHSYGGVATRFEDMERGWSMASSLLFTVSVVTTIGYGHVTPVTKLGQLTLIFYALVGIPLMLMFLANIGDSMARFFRIAYSRGCCFCCIRRRNHEISKFGKGKEVSAPFDADNVNVPIMLSITAIGAYIFLGAILFAAWNDWTWITAAYFSFVTLSTIGFGDLIPGWSSPGSGGNMKLAVSTIYIIVGLAVLSMAFNLMIEEMMQKFRWLGRKIGIIEDKRVDDHEQLLHAVN